MANDIFVEPIKVIQSADSIKRINEGLTKNFTSTIDPKIRSLQNNWDGQAASKIIGHYFKMQSELVSARENELQNYELILRKAVGEGYEQTENANTKLAELFK